MIACSLLRLLLLIAHMVIYSLLLIKNFVNSELLDNDVSFLHCCIAAYRKYILNLSSVDFVCLQNFLNL